MTEGSAPCQRGWPRPLHTPLRDVMGTFSFSRYTLDFEDMLNVGWRWKNIKR
jgi:hypothetical protein